MAADDFDKTNFLRVGVKGGGCSGMTYVLGFDQKLEDDQVYVLDGFSFIMNKGHEIIFSACSNNLVGFLQNK